MTSETNVQVVLASRPQGEPTPENFKIVEAAVPEAGPRPDAASHYLSVS